MPAQAKKRRTTASTKASPKASPKATKRKTSTKKKPTPSKASKTSKASKPSAKKVATAAFHAETGVNGTSHTVGGGAAGALAAYPHLRIYNGYLHVSGTSSRKSDNTHVGATKRKDGSWELDIYQQTCAVLQNMERILKTAGAGLEHLVECVCYLTDMGNYAGFNKAWNEYIATGPSGPSRTTVAVHQLPHPNLLIEIKAVAADPNWKH